MPINDNFALLKNKFKKKLKIIWSPLIFSFKGWNAGNPETDNATGVFTIASIVRIN
jgi:hypothetical protein